MRLAESLHQALDTRNGLRINKIKQAFAERALVVLMQSDTEKFEARTLRLVANAMQTLNVCVRRDSWPELLNVEHTSCDSAMIDSSKMQRS